MTKYHITRKGEPGKCTAQEGNCPLKESDGGQAEHYDSPEAAQEAYEKKMTSQNSMTGVSRKTSNKKTAANLKALDNYLDKGYISSSEVASHTSKEWTDMAEALSEERERILKPWDTDGRAEELEKKYGVLAAEENRNKLIKQAEEENRTDYNYYKSEDRRRLVESVEEMNKDPELISLSKDFNDTLKKVSEINKRTHLVRTAAAIAEPRTFEGQTVPAGYAVFKAIYDDQDEVIAHYSDNYYYGPQKVKNSNGKRLKIRPSKSKNPDQARERNTTKGFQVGRVIAPASPKVDDIPGMLVSSEKVSVDAEGVAENHYKEMVFTVPKDSDRPTLNVKKTYDLLSGSLNGRGIRHYPSLFDQPKVTPDAESNKEFIKRAIPTSYRE